MLLTAERIKLTLQTPEEVLAWVDSLPFEVRSEISKDWVEQLQNAVRPDPWLCMFRIRLTKDGLEIGSCGFKGYPGENGIVEITYGIDKAHHRQGYATESVNALVEYARSIEEVQIVRANTKLENVASERTLVKCGFTLVGSFENSEEGLVNLWEICLKK